MAERHWLTGRDAGNLICPFSPYIPLDRKEGCCDLRHKYKVWSRGNCVIHVTPVDMTFSSGLNTWSSRFSGDGSLTPLYRDA